MAAWGPGSFDNDSADDWARECVRSSGFMLVEATLDNLLGADADELEAADAEEAIAAADVVACAAGRHGEHIAYPKPLTDWIATLPEPPDSALLAKAALAIGRIRCENFELRELWSDSDGFAEWCASLDGLLARL
jgi:hypothetical protein